MKKSILFCGLVALVCSCSAPKATTYSYSEYKSVNPSTAVYAVPTMADLVVTGEKITYGERINKNITTLTDAEVEALASSEKETVIANACKANNADVIVAPNVSITTDASHNLVIVVTGYPAVYKNFRTATPADTLFINSTTAPAAAAPVKNAIDPLSIFKKK